MIEGVIHSQTQKALSSAVFNYYNNKRNDRNLMQSQLDGYVHHHFGINGRELSSAASQDEITTELQRQETEQTDKIISLLELNEEPCHVYDVGCGRGGTMFRLLDKHPGVVVSGINLTEYQTNFCVQEIENRKFKDRAIVVQGDYLNAPFNSNEFTHIVVNEVTPYASDLSYFFQEMYRVLKPNGIIVLATWCYNDEKDTADFWKFLVPICEHYASSMHGIKKYREAASKYFNVVKELDYSRDLINYWKLRKNWKYQSGIEQFFLDAYKADNMKYLFFVLNKSLAA